MFWCDRLSNRGGRCLAYIHTVPKASIFRFCHTWIVLIITIIVDHPFTIHSQCIHQYSSSMHHPFVVRSSIDQSVIVQMCCESSIIHHLSVLLKMMIECQYTIASIHHPSTIIGVIHVPQFVIKYQAFTQTHHSAWHWFIEYIEYSHYEWMNKWTNELKRWVLLGESISKAFPIN